MLPCSSLSLLAPKDRNFSFVVWMLYSLIDCQNLQWSAKVFFLVFLRSE
uniref:Uncharacterized protein n=1 Tax=Anguilla anguilla TaxID=7936 RepID=A0A0E9VWV6_ANGAN